MALAGVAAATLLKTVATASALGVIWLHVCGSWTGGASSSGGRIGVARSGTSGSGVSASYQCPPGGTANGMQAFTTGANVSSGARSYWEIDAPGGLTIIGARTVSYGPEGMVSYGMNTGQGWGGGFYWKGGGAQASSGEENYTTPLINSPYLGWQVVCGARTCDGVHHPAELAVLEMEVEVGEASGPTIAAGPESLGATTTWVRGKWPIAFVADGPSGACQLSATLDGMSVSQPVNEPSNPTSWHQCPVGGFFSASLTRRRSLRRRR